MQPSQIINEWLDKESTLGSPAPNRAVLASASKDGEVHSRIVAIREINDTNILFFTQSGTRKDTDFKTNPSASMTFWLPLQQREVMLDGTVEYISEEENQKYWGTMPRERQLLFSAYAPTSGKAINSIELLKTKLAELTSLHNGLTIPLCTYYCGIRFIPNKIIYYTLGSDSFSDVAQYTLINDVWVGQQLSP